MVVGLLVYTEINKETVIIETFQVPADLEKQNITGQAVVNKLLDQIEIIKSNADTSYKKLDVKPTSYDSQLEMVIPGSGISLKSLLQNLKTYLGKNQTRISGEIVLSNQKLNLTIRVLGKPSKTFSGNLEDLDKLLKDAAEYILKYTEPYLLAYYLYYNYDQNNKEDVLDMIKFTLSHPPADDDAMAYTLDGYIKEDEENYEDAIKLYKKALEIDPKYVDAYNGWAYSLYEMNKLDSAISLYNISLGIDPAYSYTYYYLGLVFIKQDKFQEGFDLLDKSIKLNPNDVDIYEDYGRALIKLKQYDKAIDILDKAINLDTRTFESHCLKGTAQYELKNYEEAIKDFQFSINENPTFVDAYIGLGNSYYELGKFSEALSEYRKAAEISNENKEAYKKIALTLEKQNKTEEAIIIYKKISLLSPQDSALISDKINELKNVR